MIRRLFTGWAAGLLTILLMLPHVSYADIYMKQKQHVDAVSMMGQTRPAEDLISETWISASKMAANSERQKVVVDIDKKIITFADHKKKTIMTMPLDFSKMIETHGENMSPEEKAEFQHMMGKMMDVKVKVEATSEKKKIGKWNCKKYIQTLEMGMGTVISEIWATRDIKVDEDLYAKYNAAMMAQMPGISQNIAKIMQEMKKIKGVHVFTKQTTEMMGQSFGSSTELLEYNERKVSPAVFDMPSGYTKQSLY